MSKCIKCGNFYLSDPETDDELCFNCEMEEKEERIAELEKEKNILHKALELSCEFLCGLSIWDKLEYDNAIQENIDYFIQQAKESLK